MTNGTFVISAAKDDEVVRKLRHDLDFRGVPTESAEDIVRPGADFAVAIQRSIRQARVVLVVLSRTAADRAWVATETSFAVSGQMLGAGKVVIPVIIEPGAELPFFIKHLQYVDLSTPERYDRGLSQLVDAVRSGQRDVERPEKRQEARRELLLAEREAFEIQRSAQVAVRLERSVLLTSALATFLGAVVSVFSGLVAAGALKFAWINPSGAFGFLAGMLTGVTAFLVFFLFKKRARETLEKTPR